jgi:hypothetical protein
MESDGECWRVMECDEGFSSRGVNWKNGVLFKWRTVGVIYKTVEVE